MEVLFLINFFCKKLKLGRKITNKTVPKKSINKNTVKNQNLENKHTLQYLTESEKTSEFEYHPDDKDKSLPQIKDELTGTLVTLTTPTEQAATTATTTATTQVKSTATRKPAQQSKHKQIIQDVPIETTLSKVIHQENLI